MLIQMKTPESKFSDGVPYHGKTLVSSDGDPQFDYVIVRGMPHRREVIEDLERQLHGTLVVDERVIVNLDTLSSRHAIKYGERPALIEDEQTHDRFVPIFYQFALANVGLPVETTLYFRLNRKIVGIL